MSSERRQTESAQQRGGEGMEVIIKGEVKEIAALLLEIEGRHVCDPHVLDADQAAERIKWLFQKHFSPSSGIRG